MNKRKYTNFKAFFMLFIITISSIGMPLITHSCSHNEQKDIHIFSSEHHCEDDCKMLENTKKELGFNKTPCCSFETNFLKNDNLIATTNQFSNKQLIILYSLFLPKEKVSKSFEEKLDFNSRFHKLYGYQYRIAMQSFLC